MTPFDVPGVPLDCLLNRRMFTFVTHGVIIHVVARETERAAPVNASAVWYYWGTVQIR